LTKVAIIGVGYSGYAPLTPHMSFKEMMFEAAKRAYTDAGINPRTDVGSFICCEEDLWEGISITDEYVPDQLGGAQRAVCTVSDDGLVGLINGYMQIKSGLTDVVVVESHSKLSNVLSQGDVTRMSFEPYYERPFLTAETAVALEMRRYMFERELDDDIPAMVVAKNKKNGLGNPRAPYSAILSMDEVLSSPMVCEPLRKAHIPEPADGCSVTVLASEEKARILVDQPVWIRGVGWFSDTPWVSQRDFSKAVYAEGSSKMAYKMAGVNTPAKHFDFIEVDDSYGYKELQHLEALGVYTKENIKRAVEVGETDLRGPLPVNPSGGKISLGDMVEANGLVRVVEAVLTLRGQGPRSLRGAKHALVQSWRGPPTASGSTVILEV
jgi:acetyl-CoA C-acetyltransferase